MKRRDPGRARTGIYGGTFDPFHNGHLAVALAGLRELALDEIVLMPAAIPPHKERGTTSAWRHRLGMIDAALSSVPEPYAGRLSISTLESRLPPPSYTCNTLRALQREVDDCFFFLLGVDAFLEITTWEEYTEIFSLVYVAISPRKGFAPSAMRSLLTGLGYRDVTPWHWKHAVRKDVFVLKSVPPSISSSEIREALCRKKQLKNNDLLAPGVLEYIDRNRLYDCARP